MTTDVAQAARDATALQPGIHRDLPMCDYLALDALSGSRLEWLAVSPLQYRYMLTQPHDDTAAKALGTAVHMAVLEPELFRKYYVLEPNLAEIGGAKPRATKAYKDAVAFLEEDGSTVMRADEMAKALGMRDAILAHPHAAALLKRAPERELTAIWKREERVCRARFDLIGPDVIGNLKTTRRLKDFSPWTITRMGYYRSAGWQWDGAKRCGRRIGHFFFVAVESSPPFDVGVFSLEPDMLQVGLDECEHLLRRLEEAEAADEWPGQFPDVVPAQLSDAIAMALDGESESEE